MNSSKSSVLTATGWTFLALVMVTAGTPAMAAPPPGDWTTAVDEAYAHQGDGRWVEAADAYEKSIVLIKAAMETDPESPAKDKLGFASNNFRYCLGQLPRARMDQATSLAGQGKLEEASRTFVEAAEMYQATFERLAHAGFQQNRTYCLDRSAYIWLQAGERLQGEGSHAEAVHAYDKGVEWYRRAEQALGEGKFAENIAYMTSQRASCVFQDALANHGTAPMFDLVDMDGQRLELDDFKGKVVLLDFWAAWCGPCHALIPTLEELHAEFQEQGLVVLGVCVDKTRIWNKGTAAKAESLARTEIDYPVVWAEEQTLIDYGDFRSIPTVMLVDRAGKLRLLSEEPSKEALTNEIETLLAESDSD